MFKDGDRVKLNPESSLKYMKNMDFEDLYQVESFHMDFSFGMGPTPMYKIKNLKTGEIQKLGSNMIIYDINFLRKQKLQKICSKLVIK